MATKSRLHRARDGWPRRISGGPTAQAMYGGTRPAPRTTGVATGTASGEATEGAVVSDPEAEVRAKAADHAAVSDATLDVIAGALWNGRGTGDGLEAKIARTRNPDDVTEISRDGRGAVHRGAGAEVGTVVGLRGGRPGKRGVAVRLADGAGRGPIPHTLHVTGAGNAKHPLSSIPCSDKWQGMQPRATRAG